MTGVSDWNRGVVEEFRANAGRVGGPFEGAPMLLLHHRGRRSGAGFVAPVMYLPSETDADTVYVFATKSGAPTNPDWYPNLMAAGTTTVEVGPASADAADGVETRPVTVEDVTGAERDRIYAEQARRYPGFAEYESRTAGIRTIPVLALHRSS